MNSETLSSIKNKLKTLLRDKRVIDILLFGSTVKGKTIPRDIDIAIISNEKIETKIKGFHISLIKPSEFFHNVPMLVTTLLREGYSLKTKKSLAETLRFESAALFVYNLTSLTNSEKVRIVNILKGKGKTKGMVEEYNGKWIANQVFTSPVGSEYLFEKMFLSNNVKFKKNHILIH